MSTVIHSSKLVLSGCGFADGQCSVYLKSSLSPGQWRRRASSQVYAIKAADRNKAEQTHRCQSMVSPSQLNSSCFGCYATSITQGSWTDSKTINTPLLNSESGSVVDNWPRSQQNVCNLNQQAWEPVFGRSPCSLISSFFSHITARHCFPLFCCSLSPHLHSRRWYVLGGTFLHLWKLTLCADSKPSKNPKEPE